MSERDPNRWKALAVLGVAYLMVVLDIAIVNVALPSIGKKLHFPGENLQWVVSAYSLTFGGFLLLGGRIGDLIGRRRVFMAGLLLFAVFSLLCGLATSEGMLITFRGLQGLAAALLSPSVFSIVSVTFEEGKERNIALGVLGGIGGAGAAIGVLLGGILTQYLGWAWIFFVNVPIGLLALLVVPVFVRESKNEGQERAFDAAGASTITASLIMLVYALTQAEHNGWGSGLTIGLIVGAIALLGVFLAIESRVKHPLMPLTFFRKRTPTGANIIGFGLGTMVFGMFFLLSLYMQQILGFSALKTGIGYLAVALTAVVASGVSQALVTKAGAKPILMIGMVLLGGGLVYFTQIDAHGAYFSDLFPGFLLTGVGLGFSFVPVSIAALAGIEPSEAGLASGLINTVQQIGGALGVAILTTVATTRATHLIDAAPAGSAKQYSPAWKAAYTSGYSLAFWVAVGFAAASFVATLLLLRRDDLATVPAGAPAM